MTPRSPHCPSTNLLGEFAADKLLYYPTVTREAFRHQGRVTELLFSGQMPAELGLAPGGSYGGSGNAVRKPWLAGGL